MPTLKRIVARKWKSNEPNLTACCIEAPARMEYDNGGTVFALVVRTWSGGERFAVYFDRATNTFATVPMPVDEMLALDTEV